MKVVCINDANRPKQIPPEKWIKEGEVYTVIATTMMNIQKNKIGLKLAEIELGQSCFPYEYFDAERFAIVDPSKVISKEEELSLEEV
jgi:hypothetical protein